MVVDFIFFQQGKVVHLLVWTG